MYDCQNADVFQNNFCQSIWICDQYNDFCCTYFINVLSGPVDLFKCHLLSIFPLQKSLIVRLLQKLYLAYTGLVVIRRWSYGANIFLLCPCISKASSENEDVDLVSICFNKYLPGDWVLGLRTVFFTFQSCYYYSYRRN